MTTSEAEKSVWFSLLWGLVGFALTFVVVGIFVLFADLLWYIYRIVKGWIRLNDGKPMYSE